MQQHHIGELTSRKNKQPGYYPEIGLGRKRFNIIAVIQLMIV